MRASSFPKRDFANMNAEEIATQVESDIKSIARKWGYKHPRKSGTRTSVAIKNAATESAALYLQANHALYFRDNHQHMKAAHHGWMILMEQWFSSIVEKSSDTSHFKK